MFKIESYVTPILLSYVDKYVRDFNPADAQVSLWGGGVALHNLVLKADVLQQEMALPFTLVSGRIHELLIQVPWTKIMSEPIIVTIDTIECILSLRPPADVAENSTPDLPSRRPQVVEAPPGYMQALVRRIVSNIALRVHHLIVKYAQDDVVLSLNVKHLAVDSAAATWEPAFADIDPGNPVIRRTVRLDDLTLCLDRSDSDGKIRYYQEPLLYRCQLDLRVLTRLVSASTRRARSVSVALRSSKLAWGVTDEQLLLLLRLLRERPAYEPGAPPPAAPKPTTANQASQIHSLTSTSAEPVRSESWSEWAWSWLPALEERAGGAEEAPAPLAPTPVYFAAYLDRVAVVFKVMESDSNNRKRARGVLELCATHAAVKASSCAPSTLRARCGLRDVQLRAHGKCVCGYYDTGIDNEDATMFLSRMENVVEEWNWPEDTDDQAVETAEVADEEYRETQESGESTVEGAASAEQPAPEQKESVGDTDGLWREMAPAVYLEFAHDRAPPDVYTNPYDNPPTDFEYRVLMGLPRHCSASGMFAESRVDCFYTTMRKRCTSLARRLRASPNTILSVFAHSDWVEDCSLSVVFKPMMIKVSTSLLHRLDVIRNVFKDLPPVVVAETPMRTLTVEECDYLLNNLPQRRVCVRAEGLRVRVLPAAHAPPDRAAAAQPPPPLVLDVDVPAVDVAAIAPLYPLRVCQAACQIPDESGALWQGARLHVTATVSSLEARISTVGGEQPRPCARADLRLVLHSMLRREYFTRRESVLFSYSAKIQEVSVCGSAARLQAAWRVLQSLLHGRQAPQLRHSSLPKDALNDEESVAIDLTVENISARGYVTKNTNTHILLLQSSRATALHAPSGGETKQAWLYSAPDGSTSSPYLRAALQWCEQPHPNTVDYAGVWTEPVALCVDPLFIAWLAYKPQPRAFSESQIGMKGFSSQYMIRRRTTPPSSSGRGGSRSGSGAELVHAVRPRSLGSGSEPSDKKEQKQTLPQQPAATSLWDGSRLVRCYERLRRTLVAVELGLALVYVTMSTASALDCATVRDAMERHAATAQRVLTISLGRLSMSASSMPKNLWHEIRHDGPTFVQPKTDGMSTSDGDRFPWRVHLADVSCYTLEVHAPPQRAGRESAAPGPRSRLRMQCVTTPRTILELVTTTVTVSVVTKSLPVKTSTKKQDAKKTAAPHEDKTKYFTSGLDFKPTTLKEFVRGPARRRKLSENEGNQPQHEGRKSPEAGGAASGPVVSLGVHLHVDTPPVIVRLDQDQVVMVAVAAHCFTHILTLLQRESTPAPRHDYTSLGGSHRSLIRSVSEVDQLRSPTEDSESEKSELIPIFEAHSTVDTELKTSFWFQWVVSRATLIVAGSGVRLAFDADDVIATVDVQPHYNQLRVKVASAAVKHYVRSSETEEWRAGRLGGRVLEAREPANDKEDNHFLAVTVTQALISNLPASWKEELHPKLLQQRPSMDNMWEVYATVAPLEAVLQPDVLDQIVSLAREMAPRSFCPLQAEPVHSVSTWQWPFFYVNAGGLRLIITHEKHQKPDTDDTIVLSVGKVTVTPHPENPIFRRVITSGPESGWTTSAAGHYEGRQYEVVVRNVAVHSAMFKQLVSQEAGEVATGGENPALKWSRSHESPVLTPLLHAVDVSCVLAPPLAAGVAPACGPALELNLVSDCALELSVEQLRLLRCLAADVAHSFKHRIECGVYNDERHGVCPYATLLMHQMSMQEDCQSLSDTSFSEVDACPYAVDSGVDTVTSHSTLKSSRTQEDLHPKKSVSVAFIEDHVDLSEYLEVFVTMGVVEVSLYAAQDGSVELGPLQPPRDSARRDPEPVVEEPSKSAQQLPEDPRDSPTAPKSLTDNIRTEGLGKIRFETYVRHQEGNLPLLHLKLHQPNLYYWKKKTQKHIQMSLFNLWLGLGGGEAGGWHAPLVTTARGACDPVTDIPPALATANVLLHAAAGAAYPSARAGSVRLEVERPVLFELSADRLVRLKAIADLITARTTLVPDSVHHADPSPIPLLYKLRRVLMHHNVESVTIETSQVGVCGVEGTAGWDAASLQVAAGARPDRVVARALLTALVAAAGPAGDRRHLLLHPLMIGAEIEATWEAWRRAEGGAAAREPTVCVRADLDRLTLDARPADLAALARLRAAVLDLIPLLKKSPLQQAGNDSMHPNLDVTHQPALRFDAHAPPRPAASATSFEADNDHYYKDDLRSGAFKLVSGGQLPMAYQVAAHGGAVAWRYPHPRAVTRLLAFPLPHLEEEVPCALEFFSKTLSRWEPHALFNLPVGEPRELKLNVAPPEAVFALTWRVRVVDGAASHPHPYVFSTQRFKPKAEPLVSEPLESEDEGATGVAGAAGAAGGGVSAQQLAGALRVDSYFAPRLLPRVRLVARLACLHLHLHNALPDLSRVAASLEGYYVSKPLLRSHRVLTLSARDTTAHAHLGSRAGALLLIDTSLASDMMECATGTMKRYVSETRAQAAVSVPRGVGAAGCGGGGYSVREARARLYADTVHVALHATRLRTAHALLSDWRGPIAELCGAPADGVRGERAGGSQREAAAAAAAQLEGRVSLWLHNTCSVALRVGQEGTDEIVPLGPGARLAYRWRCPVSPKKVRFALVGPETDWQWSNSVSFAVGACRVRLATASPQESEPRGPGAGVYLHVRVEEAGACRCMHLAGRLVLADMLRYNLLYKVRARCSDKQWRPVCSGELSAETVGRSVVCGADCDMVLKIKLNSHETGWSGDIPLKECPKENVPWLVKVPSKGDVPYVSVWCRVVRARSDGRVLAAVWPLYVLHSHLPLDTDVMITTETDQSCPEVTSPEARPPPLVQTAPGRGASTHLLAPGTTAARHALSFQYRKIDCPVTREAVPLHYGVTDTSVFDKRAPVDSIDDVMADIVQWLDRSGRDAVSPWPYSVVKSHWPQEWQSALMQPRCEVTVRYRAVRAGGGCSLEAALCPAALVCNAAPLPLTLRAHDAAPLCKLEPGTAISPPSVVLNKPFFISMEIGRETFVSGQLQVWAAELGRYGAPPPGRVAPDREAPFAIQCNNKVALLTMFYEIKEQINVFGVTPTYVILNRLETDILVSAVAVPNDVEKDVALRPKTFKCVSPTPEDSVHGTPVCRFWVQHRWRGSDPAELRAYLCIALPSDVGAAASSAAVGVSAVGAYPAHAPVPVRLGTAPLRRALALYDDNNVSRGVVVTQVRHEGRWLVSVAADPCPQFVVHNRTRISLAVAQPLRPADEPDTFNTQVTPECPGASWLCVVEPGACTHYSTPAHNARHPPPPNATRKHDACTEAMLTFAKYTADEGQPMWCSPVGAAPAGGEQLLHLFGGDSIKMRVRRHPHSTLVELQEVHQFDISASDIRRRLLGSLESENQLKTNGKSVMAESKQLERVGATEKLLTDSEVTVMKPQDEDTVMLLPQEGTLELQTSESQSSQVTATPNQPNYQPTGDPQPSNSERREAPNTLGGERTIYSVETLEGTHDRRRDGSVEKLEDPDREANPKDTTEVKAGGESGSSFVQLGVQGASLPDCSEPVSMETFAFADARAPDAEWCPRTSEAEGGVGWARCRERVRCSLGGAVVRLAGAPDEPPLLALHLGRAHLLLQHDDTGTRTSVSVAELQVDNLQYDSGQYDFAVVAATRGPRAPADARVPLWGMFGESVAPPPEDARLRLRTRHDKWTVAGHSYNELTEVELSVGPLALYIEDAYVSALARGMRRVLPAPLAAPLAAPDAAPLAEERALRSPLRLRALHVHPLDLTLTLHTAMRMYIALDQSPLRLGAFELRHVMTTTERLTHALTVHYLSAAILGAGWVVGGLELLGAPGALAARVSCASGGVRGVAAAAAAALLRSLSACAGSLARNLDLLAGDEEHARRAAAARRRPPHSLVAGLAAGITNFAINILGAVGGLAHHPLVGVAVGESEGGAMALRRGLLGALAKPLSATADLVAYAGHGLLRQTGWDPAPQPRECPPVEGGGEGVRGGWRRDCVRWTFRLADMTPLAGCEVLLDNAPLQLLLTHRFLVVADPESERIVEMLDYRSCSLVPYQGPVIELSVIQKRQSKMMESSRAVDEDDEYQISVAAMARVARYTGAEGARAVGGAGGGAAGGGEARVLSLVPPLGRSHALHAALATLIHHNSDSHLHLL